MHVVALQSTPRFDLEDGPQAPQLGAPVEMSHLAFLNIIRDRRPTQAELDAYLHGVKRVTLDAAHTMCGPQYCVLCSHCDDVDTLNRAALLNPANFPGAEQQEVVPVPMGNNAWSADMAEGSREATFLSAKKFHSLTHIRVGARVILTKNIAPERGGANGMAGTVQRLEFVDEPQTGWRPTVRPPKQRSAPLGETLFYAREEPKPWSELEWTMVPRLGRPDQLELRPLRGKRLVAIHVLMDSTAKVLRVTASVTETNRNLQNPLTKRTFPLMLAYAMTGHRAQGDTREHQTLVYITSAFAAGLLYVILSRLKSKALLLVVGELTPAMFNPMPSYLRAKASLPRTFRQNPH